MRRPARPLSLLIALLIALVLGVAPAMADAPKAVIKGPKAVPVGAVLMLDARESVADRPLRWKLDGPDVPFLTFDQGDRKSCVLLIPSALPGVYVFTLVAKGVPPDAKEIDADAAVFIVTVAPPPPPNPIPIPPPVPPVPPDPAPPDPAPPITVTKLQVLYLYETSAALTRSQTIVLNSPKVKSYLASHCQDDRGRPAWRCWDKDADASDEAPWQAILASAKAAAAPLPSITIRFGTLPGQVKTFALPDSEDAALTLLQSYGGL